jgi:hypothetical protein
MSSLFELALKAKIPVIGVQSDDLLNFKAVLQLIAKKKPLPLPTANAATVGDLNVYFADDIAAIKTDVYRKLCEAGASCVVLNPAEKSHLIFPAGFLPTPAHLLEEYLKQFVPPDKISVIVQALNGLSLKAAQEIASLTMARAGSCTASEIRSTRLMLGESTPGLEYLDTDYDFYVMPKPLEEWLKLNDKYFLNPHTPPKLMPRGIALVGAPGVGKSMAAQVIARHWKLPLFRMDVGNSLTRWLGESESRMQHNLHTLDENAPCVWLLDELEKLFVSTDKEGTMPRMLSQLLWWLQYHKSKVITVMTSNDIERVPPEVYRPGRIDKVIHLEMLTMQEAKLFAVKVFENILKLPPTIKQQKTMRDAIQSESRSLTHAEVVVLVSEMIKSRNWMPGLEEVHTLDKVG